MWVELENGTKVNTDFVEGIHIAGYTKGDGTKFRVTLSTTNNHYTMGGFESYEQAAAWTEVMITDDYSDIEDDDANLPVALAESKQDENTDNEN